MVKSLVVARELPGLESGVAANEHGPAMRAQGVPVIGSVRSLLGR